MIKDDMGGKSRFNPFAEKYRAKFKTKALDRMKDTDHARRRRTSKTKPENDD